MDTLRHVYDVPRLVELVKAAGENGVNADKQKRAMEMFLRLAEREDNSTAESSAT